MEEVRTIKPGGDTFGSMHSKLEEFRSLLSAKRTGYSISLYPDLVDVLPAVTCRVAWTRARARELQVRMADLARGYLPTISKSESGAWPFPDMTEKLDASISLLAQKKIGCSIDLYTAPSDDVPSAVTCFAACPSEAIAEEFQVEITDLVRGYFPTLSRSEPGPVN
jgi:hypothetical protein